MVAGHPRSQDKGGMTIMADPLEYIAPPDSFKGNVPISLAVKVGKQIFVSGVPGYDRHGKLR